MFWTHWNMSALRSSYRHRVQKQSIQHIYLIYVVITSDVNFSIEP
jgi:hypothetical protein